MWAIRIAVLLGVLVAVANAVDKPLWDWLQLLIVPAVIAAGVAWFNQQQRARELEIAERRTQDEALQAYLDRMADLILHENLLKRAKRGEPPELRERLRDWYELGERLQELLEPHDPGPFIGMKATFDLDSEAYTWTEIPPPDSEFWDTWKEGDPVICVRRKSPSSRWGTRAARPAATCTTGV